MDSQLKEIVCHFPEITGISEIKPLTSGLINQTYLVCTASPQQNDYVLQCINHYVFKDVALLQHNIECVTRHIRRKLEERNEPDIDRKVLCFLSTDNGTTYYFDGERYWRACVFIRNSRTLTEVNPEMAYLVGLKFGEFEAMLVDLDEPLGETIPDLNVI